MQTVGTTFPETGRDIEILEFSLGNIFYGIDAAIVRETVCLSACGIKIGTGDQKAGLRGKTIPVVRLPQVAASCQTPAGDRMIVCETDCGFAALLVDDIYRKYRLSPDRIKAPGAFASSPGVIGIAKMDNRPVFLLDGKKVLSRHIAAR